MSKIAGGEIYRNIQEEKREQFIIIIIISKGRQCKAGRERLTPYQSEDPNPQHQPIEW